MTYLRRFTTILSLALFTPALLLAQPSNEKTPPAPTAAKQQAPADADRPQPAQRNPRYKINRDDVLTLTFPLSTEFNQKVAVMPDGYINLQGAGSIHIAGMTVPEVSEAVKKAYANILHDPIVDVDLTDFQKPYFIVLGQVGKPGQYDLRYDMTVTQAVAVAGGFASTSKTQVFLYRGVNAQWVEVKQLNIKQILQGKNVNEDVHLQPGDMIFVPEKFITKFRKYIPYGAGMSFNPSNALF